MRIGVDGKKIPEATKRGPIGSLEHAHELGLGGMFFRTVLEMSPDLDVGELAAIRRRADELGMYLETGLGKVNPFAIPEAPELRAAGDGDTLLGFRRMMEACAAIDCRELWASTAYYKPMFPGKLAGDRFRTDVTWPEQLVATERFLQRLAPIARDLGIHINLETHEEITSFELVRLVEAVGPDVVGIVYDTANPLHRLEHPVRTAERVAPYVRQTHMKDAHLAHGEGGLYYQLRPCGTGVVDFAEVLAVIARANPDVNLTIENDESQDDRPRPAEKWLIEVYDKDFLAAHPDLTVEEFAEYLDLIRSYEARIAGGDVPSLDDYAAQPFGYRETVDSILASADLLRTVCAELSLPLEA
ncbi:sugar phosphate isomerase/epimerase family protein [Sinomonas sp. ASV322]|uniref:sugar phosphate isomerase/epimerase family protein n=1 Tax=Sinomonas sp. ASV322 TaxID=3041920 RepID=UPI0027DAEBD9|nr:sugar phosphate isomerase/epimerase family protein [Sinomonas sp. ASV322]MDQ4504296.1 sugar phosphate isomerase/epimerase family protein [Sinomonas sp. ASV322]